MSSWVIPYDIGFAVGFLTFAIILKISDWRDRRRHRVAKKGAQRQRGGAHPVSVPGSPTTSPKIGPTGFAGQSKLSCKCGWCIQRCR